MTLAEALVDNQAVYCDRSTDHAGYLRAIAAMWEAGEIYWLERDGVPAWGVLFDVDLCPPQALPYLAQYVGERLPAGLVDHDVAAARAWIKDAPSQIRGTPAAVARASKRYLTGTKTVQIVERHRADMSVDLDCIGVRVFSPECPNPILVENELRRKAVPADIELDFHVDSSATWALVKLDYPTWNDVKALGTWGAVKGLQLTGYQTW